ncbi:MAG: hypothetical protein V1674_06135 [Candidatus Omnitrophota bacterium]
MASKNKKSQFKDLDLEISFCEGLLEKNPDFIPALIALGDAYTKKRLYKKGLLIDIKLAKLKPADETIRYNLACSYSLAGKIEEALAELKSAIKLGYWNFDYIEKDPDLENLRKDPSYSQITLLFKKRDRQKNAALNPKDPELDSAD